MNKGYRIRWFDKKDLGSFLNIYYLSFGEKMSEEYFYWKYLDNPLIKDNALVIVAEEIDTGKLIGFRGCIPTRLRLGEYIFRAMSNGDGFVHPDHRRKGVNTMITKFLLSEFNNSPYKLYLNFGREISRRTNIKQGWKDVYPITDSVFIQNPRNLVESMFDNKFYSVLLPRLYSFYSLKNIFRFSRRSKLNVSLTSGKIEDLEKIYNEWRQKTNKIHTVRDLKYLKWRFNDMPIAQPTYLMVNLDGEPRGYFIIAKLFDKTDSVTIFDYLIYDGNSQIIFKEAVLKIIEKYKDKDTVFTWVFTSPGLRSVLSEIGFLESTSFPFNRLVRQRFFVTRPTKLEIDNDNLWEINGRNITNLDSWYITPSSCDIRLK